MSCAAVFCVLSLVLFSIWLLPPCTQLMAQDPERFEDEDEDYEEDEEEQQQQAGAGIGNGHAS